jgi:formamidopyrimidine-DNA glycosylase
LLKAIEKVLKAGIKYRGASDQYYLDALGHKGSYQDHFLTYGREGKKCFDCKGEIKRIKIGGRGTFYCPACQR